jgi:uncharacterized protein DUF6900
MRNVLQRIAKKYLRLNTLDRRNSDSLDFHHLAVWQIRIAFEAAYRAGKRSNSPRELRKAIRELIAASDDLTSAIEGATDQFDPQKGALMDATSAAEKALKGGAA